MVLDQQQPRMQHMRPEHHTTHTTKEVASAQQLAYEEGLECLGLATGIGYSLSELFAAFVQRASLAHDMQAPGTQASVSRCPTEKGTRGDTPAAAPAASSHPCGAQLPSFREVLAAFEVLAAEKCGGRRTSLKRLNVRPPTAAELEPKRVRSGLCEALKAMQPKATTKKQAFYWRLHAVLEQLPPNVRREVIATKLDEAQRRGLEQWMLLNRMDQRHNSHAKQAAKHVDSNLTEKSLCRFNGRGGRVGFRPILHLWEGLYLQASFTWDATVAIGSLGMLVAIRALCRQRQDLHQLVCRDEEHGSVLPARSLALLQGAQRIRAAVQRVVSECPMEGRQFYYKARLKLSGKEITTKMQADLNAALNEWLKLHATRSALLRGIVSKSNSTSSLTSVPSGASSFSLGSLLPASLKCSKRGNKALPRSCQEQVEAMHLAKRVRAC
mmetsp:Transcript_18418/g.43144  ORF Transcript_18418/g.43144 Transcript_18418/m.43144 type:complete len:440 (-) Transcript_18418:65-1384(-)